MANNTPQKPRSFTYTVKLEAPEDIVSLAVELADLLARQIGPVPRGYPRTVGCRARFPGASEAALGAIHDAFSRFDAETVQYTTRSFTRRGLGKVIDEYGHEVTGELAERVLNIGVDVGESVRLSFPVEGSK